MPLSADKYLVSILVDQQVVSLGDLILSLLKARFLRHSFGLTRILAPYLEVLLDLLVLLVSHLLIMLNQLLLLFNLYLDDSFPLFALLSFFLGNEVFESSFDDVEILLSVVLDGSEEQSFSLFLLHVHCFPSFEGCLAAGQIGTDHVVLQLKLGASSCILDDSFLLKRLIIGLVYKFA